MTVATVQRTSLLLVEGDDSGAERIDVILQAVAAGAFELERVRTVAEATSYLDKRDPDCVLIDLDLPGSEGLGVVEKLAAQAPGTPLVVLTDRPDDEFGVAIIKIGASDQLSKSELEGELLVRSIRFAILRKAFETSLAEAQRTARIGSWDVDLSTNDATWSRELHRLFAFTPDERPTFEAIIERIHPDDRGVALKALRTTTSSHRPFLVDVRIPLDGGIRWVRVQGRVDAGRSGETERLRCTAQDVTEQKNAEEALKYQSLHDPLTGLPNRELCLDRLGQALQRLARQPSTVGLIYLNIDRFKVVNDSLGHPAGDQLLVAMATRLLALVRPGDTLARLGGDEFVMICDGLSGQGEAVEIADQICLAALEPVAWEGRKLVLSVSAGVAVSTSPIDSPHSLLRDADAAMYRAKSTGRGRSAVFTDTMRATAVLRLDMEIELRQAMANGDMHIHYQPIVTVTDGRILGHEALVRWTHATRGPIGPDQFISIAEETGLIVPLGAWVLRQACRQAKQFQMRDPRWSRLTMSVNLSGAQLRQEDLAALVSSAVRDADLKPEYLQLEMTESVLMDDAASTIGILTTLKGLGVRLGVDDFGTGYSSLSYLRRFPVDVLKIDRSFVDGLGKDLEDSAVVAAVVSLADTLGFTTVAEGVETRLQRDCLIGLGCSRAQGYLFARPASASDSELLLDATSQDARIN